MTSLLLHVGAPKTASSALQSFLSNNRHELRREGILYPFATSVSYAQGNCNSFNIELLLADDYAFCINKFVDKTKLLSERLKCSCVVLSSENFCSLPHERLECLILNLKKYFDVKIFMAVRDPLDWMFGVWMQEHNATNDILPFDKFIMQTEISQCFNVFNDEVLMSCAIYFVSYDDYKKEIIKTFFDIIGKCDVYHKYKDFALEKINRRMTFSESFWINIFSKIFKNVSQNICVNSIISYEYLIRAPNLNSSLMPDPSLVKYAVKQHKLFFQLTKKYISPKQYIKPMKTRIAPSARQKVLVGDLIIALKALWIHRKVWCASIA